MAKLALLRVTSVIGLLSLALLFVSFYSLLGTASIAGIGRANSLNVTVDRSLKGDRQPVLDTDALSNTSDSFAARFAPVEVGAPSHARHAQAPIGCDPAFSPIFSRALGNVYRRCVA